MDLRTILLILLALSCIIPAFAAEGDARTVQTVLGDGLTLTQLNSYLSGVRRQQFTLDYEPGGSVQPLVLYGDTLYGKSTVNQVVDYAESLGYHVLAAVNSDYFFTGSGIPTGMTIQDGVLVTSDGSWNAVGILENGKAFADTPKLSLTLTTEDGREYPIYALNNVRTAKGIYFSYKMSFRGTTNIRIARHKCNTIYTDCKNNSFQSKSCTGKSSFTTRVTCAYHTNICFDSCFRHTIHRSFYKLSICPASCIFANFTSIRITYFLSNENRLFLNRRFHL